VNLLRRISIAKLLLVCGATVAIGASATALALALGSGPTPPPAPLAQAIHGALVGAKAGSIQGLSAEIKLTNNLLEGASLARDTGAGSGIASSPLITGASGRLWVAKDGRARLELQSEKGDTEVIYDGHTVTVYDAASNTIYRYTPQQEAATSAPSSGAEHESAGPPSVAKIEEALAKLGKHANVSGATPADVAGRPAYTVRVSPSEGGSLLAGAELSFDAGNGVPLRSAVYSTASSSPVIELAASSVSFEAVPDSIFKLTPPANAKVQDLKLNQSSDKGAAKHSAGKAETHPKVTSHGHGLSTIGVLEAKASSGKSASATEGLPTVKVNGATASELRTELGTILTFERAGVRYVVGGAVPASAVEALAKGL
jgi:outer membrane lipoprotein-sorting protein